MARISPPPAGRTERAVAARVAPHRLGDVVAALELLPESRDHQQRVVDPQRQSQHPDDPEREQVDLDQVEQKAQYAAGRGNNGTANNDRQQRREHRSEDEQQDEQQDRHGNQLADRVGFLAGLAQRIDDHRKAGQAGVDREP